MTTAFTTDGQASNAGSRSVDMQDIRHSNLHLFPYEHVRSWTDDFNDKNKLGEGLFGAVYYAVDHNTSMEYAVKKLSDELRLGSPQQRQFAARNFENERCVLERYRHPNIIPLLGYALQPSTGSHCLVYELMRNATLRIALAANPSPLSWQRRVRVAVGLAKALNYLHRADPINKVFHRDVSSANIGLDSFFTPKLLDCGLATQIMNDRMKSGLDGQELAVVTVTSMGSQGNPGTVEYMCPLYATSGRYGEVSEVFSFGVVLLELLTGQPPAPARQTGLDFFEAYPDLNSAEKFLPLVDRRSDDVWPEAVAIELVELACRCLDMRQRLRPSFKEIVRVLSTLQNQACSTDTPMDEMMLAQPRAVLEKQAVSYNDSAATSSLREPGDQQCTICLEEHLPERAGVCCAEGHFVCDACFLPYVQIQSEELDVAQICARDASIRCPIAGHGCTAPALSERVVAAHVDDYTFNTHLRAKERMAEQRAIQSRNLEEQGLEDTVERHRDHIVQRLLTNRCPRAGCQAAWYSFDGCNAVKCYRCNGAFCPFCLEDCGEDAHNHVAFQCPLQESLGDLYEGGLEKLRKIEYCRRLRALTQYLRWLDPALQTAVLGRCRADFQGVGIEPETLLRQLQRVNDAVLLNAEWQRRTTETIPGRSELGTSGQSFSGHEAAGAEPADDPMKGAWEAGPSPSPVAVQRLHVLPRQTGKASSSRRESKGATARQARGEGEARAGARSGAGSGPGAGSGLGCSGAATMAPSQRLHVQLTQTEQESSTRRATLHACKKAAMQLAEAGQGRDREASNFWPARVQPMRWLYVGQPSEAPEMRSEGSVGPLAASRKCEVPAHHSPGEEEAAAADEDTQHVPWPGRNIFQGRRRLTQESATEDQPPRQRRRIEEPSLLSRITSSFFSTSAKKRDLKSPPPDYVSGTLRKAAAEGRKEEVEHLLSLGVDPNDPRERDLVFFLKKNSTDLPLQFASTTDEYAPLHCAASKGFTDTVLALMRGYADANILSQCHCTPLYVAALAGHATTVSQLLRSSANPNIPQENSIYPMHRAAGCGHLSTVTALHWGNAMIDPRDKNFYTPLHYAARAGHHEVVAQLLNLGADIQAEAQLKCTPLHCTSWSGHMAATKVLVDNGADILARDENGDSPIDFAKQENHMDVARFLTLSFQRRMGYTES
ncbi:hypothetical protein CYMTET_8463 [Cymbomonas tetramitiformis]|uniref:Protein kinase domain-containing protein n=1 Tax=Cymbomonas tetramitiformis TaxID=36881 RepID=A0AAE0GTF4_9CHLO|nr:hypothetical protein CYMTET_8463 [Cymbomonas tetramitiformis]